MNYKEKYEQALEIARKELVSCGNGRTKMLQRIFPELNESEDERIRREIIDFLWKEKIFLQEAHSSSVENNPKYRFVMDAIAWLENQNHDGKKWIYEDVYLKEKEQLIQDGIDEVLENPQKYGLEKQGETNPYSGVSFEYNGHIWGMCARDGGVEIWSDRHLIVHLENEQILANSAKTCKDADKKEPKEIEQKPSEKVEPFDKFEGLTDFERTLADICIGWIGEEPGWKQYIKDNADILLKIAIEKFNSVQDTPFEQKSAWSEEDSVRLQRIIDFLWYNRKGDTDTIYQQEQDIDWLKSRYTWKPSDEQMDALQYVYRSLTPPLSDKLGWNSLKTLELMYQDLKKLKE